VEAVHVLRRIAQNSATPASRREAADVLTRVGLDDDWVHHEPIS
jgi:hypothetical protein